MRNLALLYALAWLAFGPPAATAGDATPSLAADVLPLLKARCVKCHGPADRKAKLDLATPAGLARGGESGPAVVAGKPDEGELWFRVEADDMPPEEPLSAAEKGTLRRWIGAGAPGLPAVVAGAPEGADHWAFAPLARPTVPAASPPASGVDPIDAFLFERLKTEGIAPAPAAGRPALARRLAFDLTGLPPTPEEVDAFVDDGAPGAYERLVDRLLASPRHGERWGKYWLDAAGYADSNGYFSADSDRPLAYRYRDWVIKAVNVDLPFDEFVRLQLAGDEVSGYRPGGDVTPATAGALAATHYLRNAQDGTGESDGNPDEVRADRYSVLEGAAQIIGSSLLGLTVQCARCHDHKFEPVSQREYYSLQAVLWPAFPLERWAKPNERVVHAAPLAEIGRWEAEMKEVDAALAGLEAEYRDARRGALGPRVTLFRDAFDGPAAKGNLLIDGDPAGGASVHGGYPGPGSKGLGKIGGSKYETNRTYGVRVTNAGGGKFRLEHLADGDPEGKALALDAGDLPDGGFGFEYCCGRGFAVDDVAVSASDPSLDPAALKALTERAEGLKKGHDAKVKAAAARRRPEPGATAWVTDLVASPPDVRLLNRGNYGDPGPRVEPGGFGVLTDPDNPYSVLPPAADAPTTGYRLAFARWLTRPGSRPAALLARVTVNRAWQYHFGTGLVATSDNFGYSGAPPSHPELLEELAAGFVESGWSLKALHRRIVLTAAYRRDSLPVDPERSAGADPDNRLLGHYPARRLDAEAVRDAQLAVSGGLDPTPFGPYVPTTRRGDGEVVVDESTPGARRRSVYLQQRRTQVANLLEVFDAPSIVTSCPKRSVSTIPLQSLSLLNSEFARRRAAALADRLAREAGDDPGARLDRAFRLAAGRPPDARERAASLRFLQDRPGRAAPGAAKDAWVDFCQMLLASNALLYVE